VGLSRVGLFGGTFNPIHLGHLRAAEEVREALDLERVVFIPSAIPPHKRSDPRDPIASAAQRLEWVELAIADHALFVVDRIEIDRPGRSYLVDTLKTFRESDPAHRPPVFIVGEDAFAEMGEWLEPERLFELADYAVLTRPPGHLRRLDDRMPSFIRPLFDFDAGGSVARHRKADTRIELVPITALDISSSAIREARRAGRSIRFLVPEPVRHSIEKSGCYAEP
jgi:nicotinate-nucleotide adenylyltransferase